MKKEKLLLSMNLIDENYIEEADPKNTKVPFNWRKLATVAACFAILLTAVGVGVGVGVGRQPKEEPIPAHLLAYADSEYFSVIQKLDVYYAQLKDSAEEDRFLEKVPTGTTTTLQPYGQYEETTDNQVAGVIEADLIKRSDQYIYYLTDNVLNIYSIAGEDSERVGTYMFHIPELHVARDVVLQSEFYLSADCRTVTIIVSRYQWEQGESTEIIALDVSDPTQIVEKNTVYLNSSYLSSRSVDGTILLMGRYSVKANPDYSDVTTFVPQISTEKGSVCIPMEGIIAPDELSSSAYTVLCTLDEETLALKDSAAFLSYSQEVYVSEQTVYATRTYSDVQTKDTTTTTTTMTEISGISYRGDSLDHIGSVSIAGSVKDQYSMDEHNGILRAVTTTSVSKTGNDEEGHRFLQSSQTSASLYCIDLSKWKVVAKVENFAPEGESVQSVRFDGDAAYVCTAEVVTFTDPVFFFDLSDLKNITYTDTGTIQGYSTSLISFGDGYLVGIGVGESGESVKLEVYRESDGGVVSVGSYEVGNAWSSTDYKSYLIDRKNQLIGLGIYEMNYEPSTAYYHLLSYRDGKLTLINKTRIKTNYYMNDTRAVYIDGYLYMFSSVQFEVVPVDLSALAQ